MPETHHHSFALNWLEAEGRMRRGKLPCAEPPSEPLATNEDLRDFVGRAFLIEDMHVVPRPPWIYDLVP